jgi:hypothetical protein
LLGLSCLAISLCAAQIPSQKSGMDYQLWSWQDSDGSWNFCMLPDGISGHCDIRGMPELKRRISVLPAGAVIHWIDQTPGSGTRLGTYPPASIIRQVRAYAQNHRIKMEILSSNPLGPASD